MSDQATDYPPWIDEVIPYHGECGFCGAYDARHRVLEAISGRVLAGDSPESVAADYNYPIRFVKQVALATFYEDDE